MGWLDKKLKNIVKSPLGKAAIMGGLAMTPWGRAGIAALGKSKGATGGMGMLANLWAKPLISKPLTNAAMSYGLAKLTRAKNPGRAALWSAGLTLPFLGMQAQAAAKGTEGASMWDVLLGRPKVPGTAPEDWLKNLSPSELNEWAVKGGFKPSELAEVTGDWSAAYKPPFLSAGEAPFTGFGLETVGGKEIANVGTNISTQMMNKATTIPELQKFAELGYGQANKLPIDLSYWMKPELTEGTPAYNIAMAKAGNKGLAGMIPDLPFKFLPTATPLGGGVYASREERDQAWERIKNERRQQLAWMYGVDPEDITGEMTNPFYNVDAPDLDWKYANQGGIMDLDAGGDVSGPGTGTSDSINAKLSDGEFVMTAKAVENFGGGSRQAGANKMYQLMNQLDPQSETPQEGMS